MGDGGRWREWRRPKEEKTEEWMEVRERKKVGWMAGEKSYF